jgi:hypothetical protein
MAYVQGGGVDKTDSRRLPLPEKLGIDELGEESVTGQFHEPVVTDRSGKKTAQVEADVALVIAFEAAAAVELEQQDNGHYLT